MFLDLQRLAMREIKAAESTDLTLAFTQLEAYGLGRSFRISSILRRIHSLLQLPISDLTNLEVPDVDGMQASVAEGKTLVGLALSFATATVLRDLKFRARIPVKGYSLVGVADEWGMLEEGDVYVCVTDGETGEPSWLEGQVMVSRSPTTHLGGDLCSTSSLTLFFSLQTRPLTETVSLADVRLLYGQFDASSSQLSAHPDLPFAFTSQPSVIRLPI